MDLLVFSHLRWDFVYQRPQHLISRFARENRVWFFEEPVLDGDVPFLHISERKDRLKICTPHLAAGMDERTGWNAEEQLLLDLLLCEEIEEFVCWYYTPMAVEFTRTLNPVLTVYDCMDELSAFRGAPPGLCAAEQELFRRANLVFTGGQSLYESKRLQHPKVYPFPSSIDASHFNQARLQQADPPDQREIPRPRIGFAGVIDERLDTELLRSVASTRPNWQFVMVGPVVKISDEALPKAHNIHYLGSKPYEELPSYMAGWDIGMLPFARNESTRFISPTKTPEYLAAGLPVVSTSIKDVQRPYGELGLVEIADDPGTFIQACERLLTRKDDPERLTSTDAFLSVNSWEITWNKMKDLLTEEYQCKRDATPDGKTGQMANITAF